MSGTGSLLDDADQPERGDPQPPGPQWGIFDQSLQPVIVGDSCLTVDYRKEFRISDYPVEGGSFSSYNKVETPYDFKMTFTKGGSSSDRQNFLSAVAAVVASTDLYNAVASTDVTYQNANAVSYNYRRTNVEGMTLLTVEIYLEEVRPTAQATFSSSAAPIANPKNAAATSQINHGVVQPATPTPSQQAIVLPLSPETQNFQQLFQ